MADSPLMLTIREEQMAVLTQRRQNLVSAELAELFRDDFKPTFQFYSEKQLNHWVNEHIDYLTKRNITGKETVISFLELFAILGSSFERSNNPEQALELINQTERSEEIRLDNILKWVGKELA